MKRIAVCLLPMLCLVLPALAQPNNCTNAYWVNSLRCAAYPGLVPQPNFGSVPITASDVKPFTRVFLLNDLSVRCIDGTRPVMYVDKAVTGDSNYWVFTLTGGGSTAPVDTDADGVPDDAQDVLDLYADPTEQDEMTTSNDEAMKDFDGIHDPDPVRNPVFSGYNRVRIEKCSYDRFQGRAIYAPVAGSFTNTWPPTGAAITFGLRQQGYPILMSAFDALENGLTYTTWSVGAGGAIVASQETLPPLSEATKVLIVGHSGGAHGLMHNIDNIAATFAARAPNADVRAAFDANFLPSNENEVAFNAGGDAYDHVWSGTTIGNLNTFTYDGATYWPTSGIATQYTTWQAQLDASCLAAHAADSWKCDDRHHVLLNHIATPFFIREDFTDPNQEHTNNGAGFTVRWGDCPVAGSVCDPVLDVGEYRDRVTRQFETMLNKSQLNSEMATGADPSLGAGNFPTWYVWMPNCGVHGGAYNDKQFFGTTITYGAFVKTMRVWMEGFMSVGRTNLRGSRVDGWSGMFTTCPP